MSLQRSSGGAYASQCSTQINLADSCRQLDPVGSSDLLTNRHSVIKSLGARVEQEHTVHLRDARRIDQQTASFNHGLTNGSSSSMNSSTGEIDFEALVKGQAAPTSSVTDPWADDGWADSADADSFLVGSIACPR